MNDKTRSILCLVLGALLIVSVVFHVLFAIRDHKISPRSMATALRIIDLDFTRKERKMMKRGLTRNQSRYKGLREISLDNSVSPIISFSPILPGMEFETRQKPVHFSKQERIERPDNLEDVAFFTISQLAYLIRTKQVTSTELTNMYLERLKKYGPTLKCVVTLTEERALEHAAQADREIQRGRYKGLLHGIPFGVKDLLSTRGIKTTWGAGPYKDQFIDEDATVVQRLEDAGAILVAKLSMGALASDDVWYEGRTNNPHNLEQGSSGSSAGSAAATSAGLVGFSIGTETWGSIVSPSTRCRVTGLRPTYGRVSRQGAMALSWSMDKIGPICRSVEDCAIVFDVIYGPDGRDLTLVNLPFNYDAAQNLRDLSIGYYAEAFEEDTVNVEKHESVLETLSGLGIDLQLVELPDFPVYDIGFVLRSEASAAFDELTRSNRDDLLRRQDPGAWPNSFRTGRLVPAVEYINANRARRLLMEQYDEKTKDIDVYVTPSYGGNQLLMTNLTGHPCVVVPLGTDDEGNSLSITFVGKLFEEGEVLAVAKAFQDATDYHLQYPDLEALASEEE